MLLTPKLRITIDKFMYPNEKPENNSAIIDFPHSEKEFYKLLTLNDLDRRIADQPFLIESFENDLQFILSSSFADESNSSASRLFLHRILYNINRLKLFWYDDLDNYTNEDSTYLSKVRTNIESVWQAWESDQLDHASLTSLNVADALRDRVAQDLDPTDTNESLYFRNEMNEKEYQSLLAIASLDGLVEASQLSRTLGGAANEIQSMITRIFLEEYGGGQLRRKHSSFFASMLEEFGMNTKPEAYFDLIPWEVLANINHSFFLCDKNRHYLRYMGGLLYTEVSVPASFANFRQAGLRLGLSRNAIEYWDLHIKEDKKHGQWMLDDVALPLAKRYEENAWELLLGYDQQRLISVRAGKAVAESIKTEAMDHSMESLPLSAK
jgi:hypothetical protein